VYLTEHFIFRRKGGVLGGYNLESYNTPSELPMGIAACLSIGFGIAGAIVGMAEVYVISSFFRSVFPWPRG
jgi:hypothetical protein